MPEGGILLMACLLMVWDGDLLPSFSFATVTHVLNKVYEGN